jgi:hydrogenase expression/formation protein HypC
VRRHVNIGLLDADEVRVGDYVLVHVGFAMSKIDEREAAETLRLLRELGTYDRRLKPEGFTREPEVDQFKTSLE